MLKISNRCRPSVFKTVNIPALLYSSNSNIEKGFNKKPNVSDIKADYIGPPDDASNIRPILRHIPTNETQLQMKLRLKRFEAENFVSSFWKNHNKRFFTEKSEFIADRQKEKELNADEMSEFYKKFLDKNWESHFYFNIMWYMKNFELLYLAFLVNIEKGLRRIKK